MLAENGHLVGIVTLKDLLKSLSLKAELGNGARGEDSTQGHDRARTDGAPARPSATQPANDSNHHPVDGREGDEAA